MADNKRIRRPRARSAKDLTNAGKIAPSHVTAKARARQLAEEVRRLEVAIVATDRLAREHRVRNANMLPALDRGSRPSRLTALTHAQKRSRRRRLYLQAAQFAVTSSLVAGAGAWLFKLWQSLQ